MNTRRLSLSIPILVLAVVSASCGRLNDVGSAGGSPNGQTIEHPSGAADLVLRWESSGGFVSPSFLLGRVPSFSLYGDGTLVTEGVQAEIYPGPALPPLIAQRLTEDGVQAILAAARDAGLMDGDATYPFPCVADVPDTVFTVDAGGRTSVVTATALGTGGGAGSCPGVNEAARAKLSAFLAKLGDLASWLPAGSIGAEHPYTPTALRVFVQRYQSDPSLSEPLVRWPASTPLSAFDRPVDVMPGMSCGVIDGADAGSVLDVASTANQMSPWASDGARYSVLFRPLLPDESGC